MHWSKRRIPLFIILARVLQYVFEFSDRVFVLVCVLWIMTLYILVWMTKSDEISAQDAAEKAVEKLKGGMHKEEDSKEQQSEKFLEVISKTSWSWHKPPQAF